jgi:hypothetical protein
MIFLIRFPNNLICDIKEMKKHLLLTLIQFVLLAIVVPAKDQEIKQLKIDTGKHGCDIL